MFRESSNFVTTFCLNREKSSPEWLLDNGPTLFSSPDSRVAPNVFASTDPGDLFVVRNVGNMIPCCGVAGHSTADESEAAAIEFAIMNLKVRDIIVCGHSDCGAMHALLAGREKIEAPNLRGWLRHGEPALRKLVSEDSGLSQVNLLSQLNVLQQIEHLRSYPVVRERIAEGKLNLHGWWFELSTANVYGFNEKVGTFVLIDAAEAERTLSTPAQTWDPASAPIQAALLDS